MKACWGGVANVQPVPFGHPYEDIYGTTIDDSTHTTTS